MFQFTHPGRGATEKERILNRLQRVSIHAPREGCDHSPLIRLLSFACFNSRTPGGVRLYNLVYFTAKVSFNSRTPGGVRQSGLLTDNRDVRFNSRTPGGVRPVSVSRSRCKLYVSIHAPREGCDINACNVVSQIAWFQFTHPGRGATSEEHNQAIQIYRFNSRTPGGVRPPRYAEYKTANDVSIHAPREGCDD